MSTKTKIDCIAMKRKAQERIYQQTRGLSGAEQIAYFEKRAEEGKLGGWWKRVKARALTERYRGV
jgi:hypothetical protein